VKIALAVAALAAAAVGYAALSNAESRSVERGASLTDCAFLAGAWKATMGEDRMEEQWSAPDGASIMGMFRWVNADGSPNIFEILTITEEPEGVFLRLRHLDAKLQPWTSEPVPLTLKLDEASAGKAVFRAIDTEKKLAAVTYHCETPDQLRVLVEFPAAGSEPLDFRFQRAAIK
jgi:hypothetical protein